MKIKSKYRVMGLGLGGLLTVFVGFQVLHSAPTLSEHPKENDLPQVTSLKMKPEKVTSEYHYVGTVNYQKSTPHLAPIEGFISEIIKRPGSVVAAGEPVLRMSQADPDQAYLRPYIARAPIKGVISYVVGSVGQHVKQNTPLFTVIDGEPRFTFLVPSSDVQDLQGETDITLQSALFSDEFFEGRLIFLSPGPHPDYGAHQMEVALKDKGGQAKDWVMKLPPQTSVKVRVRSKARTNFLIDEASVYRLAEQEYVWAIDPNTQTVQRQMIRVLSRKGNKFEFELKDPLAFVKPQEFLAVTFSSRPLTPLKKVHFELAEEPVAHD